MADDVVKGNDELPGSISDASPREATPEPAPAAMGPTPEAKKPNPGPQQPQPDLTLEDPPKPGPNDEGYEGSQFLPNHTAMALKKALNIKTLDPHLEEMLRIASLRLTEDKTGLLIDMPQNGHTIHCGRLPDGTEIIGLPDKKMVVDDRDAKVMIGLALGRGWKASNVHGSPEEQERLWIEATRAGLAVANFQPDMNSENVKAFLASQPKPSVTRADAEPEAQAQPEPAEDFHVKSMKYLQAAAGVAKDKDVKAGVEGILKKFQDGTTITGNEEIHQGIRKALANTEERAAYNNLVDFLNTKEPKLALTKLDAAPAAQQPAASTQPPAPKADNPAPT
jgi:hypothetical protein